MSRENAGADAKGGMRSAKCGIGETGAARRRSSDSRIARVGTDRPGSVFDLAAGRDGFPRQCAHWLGMTGAGVAACTGLVYNKTGTEEIRPGGKLRASVPALINILF